LILLFGKLLIIIIFYMLGIWSRKCS